MEYNVEYFIDKFESIPEDNWCKNAFKLAGQYCANGHCGVLYELYTTEEAAGLISVFKKVTLKYISGDNIADGNNYSYKAAVINDGGCSEYQQSSIKQRILACLYDIRDKELSEANLKEASKIVSEEHVECVS